MISLLRSDLYRTVRSRWSWAVLVLIALVTLGSAISTIWLPLLPGIAYDGVTGASGALRLAGRGASIVLVIMVSPLVAAHLSCADSDVGFDRTLLSSLSGRVAYFAEKYLLTALVSGFVLAAYLVFSGIGVVVTMRPVENVEPLWQIVAWAGEGWLASCAYAFAVLLVGQLARSRAVAFVAAFLLVSGVAEQGLLVVLALTSDALRLDWRPALEAASAWMPAVTTASLGYGAAGMFAVDATSVTPALRALAVCAPLCLSLAALGAFAGSRRDLA